MSKSPEQQSSYTEPGQVSQSRSEDHDIRLPPGVAVLKFVGEGSANIVFEISLPENGVPGIAPDEYQLLVTTFKIHLLRVQKEPKDPRKPFFPVPELMDYYRIQVKPRFADGLLVRQFLIELDGGLVDDVNRYLEEMDSRAGNPGTPNQTFPPRAKKFKGSRAAGVKYGMLVEDMRPKDASERGFEIKPKWLIVSPGAPEDAVRCRTCAVARSVNDKTAPCPFYLTKPFIDQNSQPNPLPLALDDPALEHVKNEIKTSGIIETLKRLQYELDKYGPRKAHKDDLYFPLAMTLRDCTMFCKIRDLPGGGAEVTVKLGDLDKKNADAKFATWRESEEGLVKGGFYTMPPIEGSEVCLIERETLEERSIRLQPPDSGVVA